MRAIQFLAAIAILPLLPACQDRSAAINTPPTVAASVTVPAAAPPTAEELERTLMTAVFGPRYIVEKKHAVANFPHPENSEKVIPFDITPLSHTVLPTGEAVLATNVEIIKDPFGAPGDMGKLSYLSVYILRQGAGKWNVLERSELVTHLGLKKLGRVEWIELRKGIKGMAVISANKWKGCSYQALELYDLSGHTIRAVTEPVGLSSTSSKERCFDDVREGSWMITGKWQLVPAQQAGSPYDDLVVTYAGTTAFAELGADGASFELGATIKVDESPVRYAANVKRKFYELIDGSSPIPMAMGE